MANRLAGSSSPYLLQHADNPVDWWEWGEPAFEEARRRDLPVLLSVGYAACHWCHVMAHESFEDDEVAAVVNAGYVAVKVDREERPDVDAVYMAATTALTGHGGWPMTCLLTPAGDPFFAGTYLPKQQLLALLANAGEVWATQRERVLASGAHVAQQLREHTGPPSPTTLDADVCDTAARRLRSTYDEARGGFGGAPKFPPSMVLEFLLRHHARTGSADALAMVRGTCAAMARGGLYDQLGGGFARYSVDADWVVPHFEKMLYDNALLLRLYVHLWRTTGDPLARRVAEETAEFLLRDLRTDEGGFASALDADTVVDGRSHEGLTYAWTPAQLVEVLGPDDGERAAALLSVTAAGTFEQGSSTLQLPVDPDDPSWWAATRSRLLQARADRPQPSRDDKVVTAWNGLAIAALADAGTLLARPDLVAAAETAAAFVLDVHLVDGLLRRTSRAGEVGSAPGGARGPRRPRRGAAGPAPGDRSGPVGAGGGIAPGRGAGPVRRRGRHAARHRERRATAVREAGGAHRQRRAGGRVGTGRRPADPRRPHRVVAAPGCRLGGARRLRPRGAAGPTVRRVGPGGGRGRGRRPAAGGGRRRRGGRPGAGGGGPGQHLARSRRAVRASRTRPGCRCWRTGRSSAGRRAPTCVAGSSASSRSRPPPGCGPRSSRRAPGRHADALPPSALGCREAQRVTTGSRSPSVPPPPGIRSARAHDERRHKADGRVLRTAHDGVELRSVEPPGSAEVHVWGPNDVGNDEQRGPALLPVGRHVTGASRVASWALRRLGASRGVDGTGPVIWVAAPRVDASRGLVETWANSKYRRRAPLLKPGWILAA